MSNNTKNIQKLICLSIYFLEEGKLLERRCLGDFNSGAHWSDIPTDDCRTPKSDRTKDLFILRNVIIFLGNNFLSFFFIHLMLMELKKKKVKYHKLLVILVEGIK